MEYLQYQDEIFVRFEDKGFKPCYKWNTFNTQIWVSMKVKTRLCFKPCYKWNTFNTPKKDSASKTRCRVLNLVINGIPSIPYKSYFSKTECSPSFKPCYKWNTFNTFIYKEEQL